MKIVQIQGLDPNRLSHTQYTRAEIDQLAGIYQISLKTPDGKYKKKADIFTEIQDAARGPEPVFYQRPAEEDIINDNDNNIKIIERPREQIAVAAADLNLDTVNVFRLMYNLGLNQLVGGVPMNLEDWCDRPSQGGVDLRSLKKVAPKVGVEINGKTRDQLCQEVIAKIAQLPDLPRDEEEELDEEDDLIEEEELEDDMDLNIFEGKPEPLPLDQPKVLVPAERIKIKPVKQPQQVAQAVANLNLDTVNVFRLMYNLGLNQLVGGVPMNLEDWCDRPSQGGVDLRSLKKVAPKVGVEINGKTRDQLCQEVIAKIAQLPDLPRDEEEELDEEDDLIEEERQRPLDDQPVNLNLAQDVEEEDDLIEEERPILGQTGPVPKRRPLPDGCRVAKNCPSGMKRKDLVKIAKKCGVELKRPAPNRTLKNMEELCQDILAIMQQAGVEPVQEMAVPVRKARAARVPAKAREPVARRLDFGRAPVRPVEPELARDIQPGPALKQVGVQDVRDFRREVQRQGLQGLDLSPAVPDANYEEREYRRNIAIYNRILEQAKLYNQGGQLTDFLGILTRLKDIIENQHNYRAMFTAQFQINEPQAITWLKNILFRSGFACHPYQQDFAAKDYVDATFNSIYPVFEQVNTVLDEFPENVIVPFGKQVVINNNGVCLENTIKAFQDSVARYQLTQSQFNPTSSKMANLGNYATDFRSNQCLICSSTNNTNRAKSECLRVALTAPILKRYLQEKLENKIASDGQITEQDIDNLIAETFEFLMHCEGVFEYEP